MSTRRTVRRCGAVLTLACGAAMLVPAVAAAVPFDNQPAPLGCANGMGGVVAVTNAESATVPAGQQFYAIGEDKGGAGANVNWLNLNTFALGSAPLTPAPFLTGTVPQALGNTGAGRVLSVVSGSYTNSAGQTCFLIPGFDFADVPAAPAAPAPKPAG
ncbi:hypothetical protein [Antrihabitans cavernicola]|uniref:Secreted protein n=1 Tax=Antrihabitans cavernicola TaxID=2495913 RepID=A0A5A7SD30_9NOCA|nr:hypothetical protein [Spelaeibacter cavernicola]KAA0023816.1 hypothetical protein FOY51_04235 [Spelaeibacter cavernicola]